MCGNPLLSQAPKEVVTTVIKRALQFRTDPKELDPVQKCTAKVKELFPGNLIELVAFLQKTVKKPEAQPLTLEQQIVAYEMSVVQATVKNPQLLMTLVEIKMSSADRLNTLQQLLATAEQKLSGEQRALFNHLAGAISAEYKTLLVKLANPLLMGMSDDAINVAVKTALSTKIVETTEQLRRIAPEHLQKMVKVSQYQPHILRLAQLQKKVEDFSRPMLEQLKAAATNEDKAILHSFLDANHDNIVVKELTTYLQSVPEAIYPSILKGLVAGIEDRLQKMG